MQGGVRGVLRRGRRSGGQGMEQLGQIRPQRTWEQQVLKIQGRSCPFSAPDPPLASSLLRIKAKVLMMACPHCYSSPFSSPCSHIGALPVPPACHAGSWILQVSTTDSEGVKNVRRHWRVSEVAAGEAGRSGRMAGQAGNGGQGRQETVSPQPNGQWRESDAHRLSLEASLWRWVLGCSCPARSRHSGWLLRDPTIPALLRSRKRSGSRQTMEKQRAEDGHKSYSFM